MSVNIQLSPKEINIEICKNVIKMMYRRGLLDNEDIFDSIKDDIGSKAYVSFILNNKKECSIYIINAKLTSIVQGTPLDKYLMNNHHKIVVIEDMSKKVAEQILKMYKNAEFFFEHEMIEDIPSKVYIPEHKLLTEEEKEEIFEKFSESNLSIIYTTDIMARYYGAKVGDIFAIIRPSMTSGKSIFYRKVIQGSLSLIFE
jgi:DNA-directed RNA polymerase subunit H (RpoH/RPB5)